LLGVSLSRRATIYTVWCFLAFNISLSSKRELAQTSQATVGVAVPPGNYAQTCSVDSFNATTQELTTYCSPMPGAPKQTWPKNVLTISYCSGEIINRAGYLQCPAQPSTWGYGGAIPPGRYQESCKAMMVTDPAHSGNGHFTLSALCERVDVSTKYSGPFHVFKSTTTIKHDVGATLDLSNCQMGGNIDNVAGQLQCRPKR